MWCDLSMKYCVLVLVPISNQYIFTMQDPPQDVAHLQFKSRIAFKLVWCPPNFEKFVLVDDDGELVRYSSHCLMLLFFLGLTLFFSQADDLRPYFCKPHKIICFLCPFYAQLNVGKPTGRLPPSSERSRNFAEVQGSKYATAAIAEGKE